ncbi:MAG: DUF222 domain-containing protein [Acidimicrobiia bacterium]
MYVSKEWIVAVEALDESICIGAANLAAAEYEWLLQVAEFDRREAYLHWEFPSCASWLSWRVGLDARTAREKVRVAHALGDFPRIAAAMRKGHLSYAKVRSITRIAKPETEEMLVDLAMCATSNQLERVVATYRRVDGVDERVQRERRGLRYEVDDDGTMVFTVRLTSTDGATLLAALDANLDDDPRLEYGTRRADALMALVDGRAGGPSQVTVHIDEDTLAVSAPQLPHPMAVSAAAARRVACDAVVETVVERDGNPVAIGRRQRLVTGRLRRALHHRDTRCRFPGCGRRGWLHAHHLEHWIDGGRTDLANTTLLCSHHHTAVHEGGWTIEGDPYDQLVFVAPDGRRIDAVAPVVSGDSRPVRRHARRPDDIVCRDGGRLDMNLALVSLFSARPPVDGPWGPPDDR